jgi:hypothetical protein
MFSRKPGRFGKDVCQMQASVTLCLIVSQYKIILHIFVDREYL